MTYDQWKTDSGYSERDPREEQIDNWVCDDRAAKLVERLRARANIAEQEGTATARSDATHFRLAADEIEKQLPDAERYRFLRDHWGTHYPMTQEQPAEWSIQWQFQQMTPQERYGSFDLWIDRDIDTLRKVQPEVDAQTEEDYVF